MEVLQLNDSFINLIEESTTSPFIMANTIASSALEIKSNHLIPVFVKDNEPVISQADFIELTLDAVSHFFPKERILNPSVRVSHPIKGRTPDAKDKPANMLTEAEKTIYYERMAFIIEVPTITENISGNQLNLTIGGVKAHSSDNLYNKKGVDEHFKVFIGFQNKVCTNLCVSSDGLIADLKVKNHNQLLDGIYQLITNYNAHQHLQDLVSLSNYSLSERDFAQLIGKCKMYAYLPSEIKKSIPLLQFGDNQIGMVVKDYYGDQAFCKSDDGSINLWRLYNLFTGANKSSYIDSFIDRSANAFDFTKQLSLTIKNKSANWFLD